MTTKERLQAELDTLTENELAELLSVLQSRANAGQTRTPGLLDALKQVQIDAPEDFAANFEQYASGEKRSGE